MEGAGTIGRSEGMTDPSLSKAVPRLRRQLSRFADMLRACRRGTASTRLGRRPGGRSDAVAIPPTSGPVYPHPLPLSDGDQTLSVELREGRGRRGAARHGRGPARREGQRAEYRCVGCGYALVVHGQPPRCPMCRQARWENAEWRPFSQLPDFPMAPAALNDASTRLPSPTAG